MSPLEARQRIVSCARDVLAKVVPEDRADVLRSASFELMRLSGAQHSPSGTYHVVNPDMIDTVRPPPPERKP